MKVYISVDMEGVAGVIDWSQVEPERPAYALARELMIGEANAAIEGALAAGAKEITVGDSHDGMFNLLPEKMRPEARLVQGCTKPLSMMQGIAEGYDAACFIGYHAMAMTHRGNLAHTYSGAFRSCHVNGRALGEIGMNAMLAASYGAPLVFVSGDTQACAEARALLPGIGTAAVKEAMGFRATKSLHPAKAREAIAAGVKKALSGPKPKTTRLPRAPFTLDVDLAATYQADVCEMVPGFTRKSSTRIEFQAKDFLTIYKAFLTIMRIVPRQ